MTRDGARQRYKYYKRQNKWMKNENNDVVESTGNIRFFQ